MTEKTKALDILARMHVCGRAGHGYSEEQLRGIMDEREELWNSLCAAGRMPTFLQTMRQYVLGLQPMDVPDYKALRGLLWDAAHRAATGELAYEIPRDVGLLAASQHAAHMAPGPSDEALLRCMQPGWDETPSPAAACHAAAAAEAPGVVRGARSKRMRPQSPEAAQPSAWDAVAKRLCHMPAMAAFAPEE